MSRLEMTMQLSLGYNAKLPLQFYTGLDNSNIALSVYEYVGTLRLSKITADEFIDPEAMAFLFISSEWQIKPRPFLFSAVCIVLVQTAVIQVS